MTSEPCNYKKRCGFSAAHIVHQSIVLNDYSLIISFKAFPALNFGALEAAMVIGSPL